MQATEQRARADQIAAIEAAILTGSGDAGGKCVAFRKFVSTEADIADDGSRSYEEVVSDALGILAKKASKNPVAAIVVLRCMAVDDLLPIGTAENQITRNSVKLCTGALPEIIKFFKIDTDAQNYEIFLGLGTIHRRFVEILRPLSLPYGDLQTLANAQHSILGSLKHGILAKYLSPFRLDEVRITAETIFGQLEKVLELRTTLLVDVEECGKSLKKAQFETRSEASFLFREHLLPFVDACEVNLESFVQSLRGQFASTISLAIDSGIELQKRYPLHEAEREIRVAVPLRNSGPGTATDVRVTAVPSGENEDEVTFSEQRIMLGNVLPGKFSASVDTMIIVPMKQFKGLLSVEWGEIGAPGRKSEMFEFLVAAQSANVDWKSLEYWTPYSTDVAEGDQFFGRQERVSALAGKLLREPMEPFYITGQKRIGKTSLALAAAEYAKSKSAPNSFDYHYVLWGSVVHESPNASLQQLGESIERFIADRLPDGVEPLKGNYEGSLADLIRLSDLARSTLPDTKFVLIIDEFDEIHQELYLKGNLADTFFGNLRALSRCKNMSVLLIGGENMPFIMDRQGQKLNNFSRINLSYYSRETEWEDFDLLVGRPSAEILRWHEDAVSEVFNITNGNPYFAKIVCAGCLNASVIERDADITDSEVKRATERQISDLGANFFAHLWQDGIPKAGAEREPDILRRMRVLVILARCIRQNLEITASNVDEQKTSLRLSAEEISAVLNDFVRREVLVENNGVYSFVLPIFRLWLADVGSSQLIADALNEELADNILKLENAAAVSSEELVKLADSWPPYRGRHLTADNIRAWYQQVDSPQDQRILFELAKRTKFYGESVIRSHLADAHNLVRDDLPKFVITSKGARRYDILLSYVDGEGKSGAGYASSYAEENGISAECVVAPGEFKKRYNEHTEKYGAPAALIIVDDIAATGRSLSGNISEFLQDNEDVLENVIIRLITLVATAAAQTHIMKALSKFSDFNIEFRSCEILGPDAYAFAKEGGAWCSVEEEERAKALCQDIGSKIYGRSPLGYGGMALLVVFPTTTPNNSLPLLHSPARTGNNLDWEPLFPRIVN